jgi:hypothetical protein
VAFNNRIMRRILKRGPDDGDDSACRSAEHECLGAYNSAVPPPGRKVRGQGAKEFIGLLSRVYAVAGI